MNNSLKKRDKKYEEDNDNGNTSKKLKTVTNNQENGLYVTSSEIKKLIKSSNMEKLKNFFNTSKFYDNEFIKWLLHLYKNKTFISIVDLDKEISKDEYKILFIFKKDGYFYPKAKHGEDINKVDYKYGESPLFYASESGNKDLITFLLEYGADINIENLYGETAIFKTCKSGNKDLVEYLVEHGADINKEEKWYGETPLFYACKSGNKDLVEYLVEHGEDINKEDENGLIPLFYACNNGNINK